MAFCGGLRAYRRFRHRWGASTPCGALLPVFCRTTGKKQMNPAFPVCMFCKAFDIPFRVCYHKRVDYSLW